MRTYKVKVRQTRVVEVEVNAVDYMRARDAALDRMKRKVLVQSNAGWDYSVEAVKQTSEPWVEGQWMDGHQKSNVLVMTRAVGNAFKPSDIELIEDRLKAAGVKVVDRWNGAGCGSASFQCIGPRGTGLQSKPLLARLTAPRP